MDGPVSHFGTMPILLWKSSSHSAGSKRADLSHCMSAHCSSSWNQCKDQWNCGGRREQSSSNRISDIGHKRFPIIWDVSIRFRIHIILDTSRSTRIPDKYCAHACVQICTQNVSTASPTHWQQLAFNETGVSAFTSATVDAWRQWSVWPYNSRQ